MKNQFENPTLLTVLLSILIYSLLTIFGNKIVLRFEVNFIIQAFYTAIWIFSTYFIIKLSYNYYKS